MARASSRSQARKVLIVSRDTHLLIVLSRFLTDAGLETMSSWAHRHAMKWVESQTFDLVISECAGPAIPCMEFVRRIRQKQPAAVCMVLHDAPFQPDELNNLRSVGVGAVISKWDLKDVVQTSRTLWIKRASTAVASAG